MGNEAAIDSFYNYSSAVLEHAQALSAFVVFVEHRYYGKSQPYNDTKNLRGLTVDQAMADYAWFVDGLRGQLGCKVGECPTITFGGSYGGNLVAWFRQKYPQLTVGGVASSAVIDIYPK